MARFRMGGSGPDGRGLGWIAGITKRRFGESGEIYETDDLGEILALRRCPYVEELTDDIVSPRQSIETHHNMENERTRDELIQENMRKLIELGRGMYRVGMTKAELVDRIIGRS